MNYEDIPKADLPLYLKELRISNGMTQQDLGDKLGVLKHIVSDYERNLRPITPKTIRRLSQIFSFKYEEFIRIEVKIKK